MKKRLLCVTFILACTLLLSSCSTLLNAMPAAATAGQVERRMNLRLNTLKSYRVDIEAEYTMYADSTKVTGTAQGFLLEDEGQDKNDYYFYTEITNKMKSGKDALNMTIKSVTAYYDGYAYDHYKQGSSWRKLCSKMTPSEYRDYISDDSLYDIAFEDCKNRELEKTDDGYTLHFSGYSEEVMDNLTQAMGLTEDLFGREAIDIKVDITVDAEYYPKTVTMEMQFEEKTSYYQPAYRMTMTYSQFDAIERETTGLSPDSFKEVENLAWLKEIEEMIEERVNAKSGSFTNKTSVTATLLSQSTSQSEISKVTYTREKDKLTFEADVTEHDDSKKHLSYVDGEQTIAYEGRDPYTSKMTEQEAEDYIAGLINVPGLGYNAALVLDIEKTDEGYRVKIDVTKDTAVGQLVVASGANFSSGEHTVLIKVKNGEITAISSSFRASGSIQVSYNSKATLTYTGSVSVEFD